ncbi:hypothetical protein JW962_02420 [Candidatus Dojkabacteria bacterium]|nr:hypothetical protein [Candidatus Dojkabacteria bacterium]
MNKKVLGLIVVAFLLLGGLALLGGGAYYYLAMHKPYNTFKKAVTEFSKLEFTGDVDDFSVKVETKGTTKTTIAGETSSVDLGDSYTMTVDVENKEYELEGDTTEWDEPVLVAIAEELKGKSFPFGTKELKSEKSTTDEWVYSYTIVEGSDKFKDLFKDYEDDFINGFVSGVEAISKNDITTKFDFSGDLVVTFYIDKKTELLNKVVYEFPSKINVELVMTYMGEEYEIDAVVENQKINYIVNYED